MLEPIPFAGMVEIDESFDRTASHMASEYVSYNKPVAWTDGKGNYFDKNSFFPVDDLIPLYTNPTDLTDEEIIAIANGCLVGATAWHNPDLDPIEFARAILRKAQEK